MTDRLLARLERRLGRYALPNLIVYVVAGMGIVWLLSQSRPWAAERLALYTSAVAHGEVWRLLTFLFVPIGSGYLVLVWLYFTWWVGSSLEEHWGAFRFNVYYLLGAAAAIVAALVTGEGTNAWLDSSLLLAFATLFPDVTILLFFVLPLRVKWLGIATAAFMAFAFVRGDWTARASIVASIVNYAVFFSGHWRDAWKERSLLARQKSRRAQQEWQRGSAAAPGSEYGQRVCAICGAREADGADIRVCTCEKCGSKPRLLCLEHARNH